MSLQDDVLIGFFTDRWGPDSSQRYAVTVRCEVVQARNGHVDVRISTGEYIATKAGHVDRRYFDPQISGGQCRELPGKVTDFADGWDEAKVARLSEIWERWHLCAAGRTLRPHRPDESAPDDVVAWLTENIIDVGPWPGRY